MATMLCGATISLGSDEDIFAELLGINEVGFTRTTVDATSGDDAGGWGKTLASCIRRLKPLRIQVAYVPKTNIFTDTASSATLTLELPLQPGDDTSGDTISFSGTISDLSLAGQLEDRVVMDVTFTPSGAPTYTAGT